MYKKKENKKYSKCNEHDLSFPLHDSNIMRLIVHLHLHILRIKAFISLKYFRYRFPKTIFAGIRTYGYQTRTQGLPIDDDCQSHGSNL
jgi:hypothetical protein